MDLSSIRIVLVRPEEAGNVGAAARVMRNFGLSHLVLVAPRAARPAEGRKWARGAEDLLEGADVVDDLAEALAPCAEAWAATRRKGRSRGTYLTPGEAAERTTRRAAEGDPVAWVFGPESRGLATADLDRCTGRVTIPTGPEHGSLNLAQAVAVGCYEIFQAARGEAGPRARRRPAPIAEREAAYDHLARALTDIGFLAPHTRTARMRKLRTLLERAAPSSEEVRYLRGIARQMSWAAGAAPAEEGQDRGPEDR